MGNTLVIKYALQVSTKNTVTFLVKILKFMKLRVQ